MTTKQLVDVLEQIPPEEQEFPEVEIRVDEAVIRVETPAGVVEERTVRLPKATWG